MVGHRQGYYAGGEAGGDDSSLLCSGSSCRHAPAATGLVFGPRPRAGALNAAAPMRTLARSPIPKPLPVETEPCGPGLGPQQPSSGCRLQERGHGRNPKGLSSWPFVWSPLMLPHPTTRDYQAPSR